MIKVTFDVEMYPSPWIVEDSRKSLKTSMMVHGQDYGSCSIVSVQKGTPMALAHSTAYLGLLLTWVCWSFQVLSKQSHCNAMSCLFWRDHVNVWKLSQD